MLSGCAFLFIWLFYKWRIIFNGSVLLEWFYLNHETDNNNLCKIATNKQKKTMELVHNSALSIPIPISRVK